MFRVAICDSDLFIIDEISDIVHRLLRNKNYFCELETFQTVDELEYVFTSKPFSLIIIDMDLKGSHRFIKNVRRLKKNTGIILTSGEDTFWHYGYEIHAISFIVKPLSEKRMENAVLRSIKYVMTRDCLIGIKDYSGKSYSVSPAEIVYVDIIDKNITLHLTDKSEITYKGTLSDVSNKLTEPFLRCHNSYIVNMDYIDYYKRYEFILKDETQVRISKQQYKKILRDFEWYKTNRFF